ncbi:hypothetical protein FB567DRAFT_604277 [Paraphoma chrysanthemicola]|uniref:Rhodopsin domain-containing protein n=1 Tax=Paraphoma chrysanthemicola TaxID=798071 RepID=A0A8K0R5R6_9PLEO|nr:hypothetical protein FB567DRAFT_604277 [Paraphoma chrysanthemicola]
MYLAMRNPGATTNAKSTRSGFVLVSLYSWMVITLGVVIARFVRGLLVHKVKFGADDATALAAHITYVGVVVGWQYTVDGGLGRKFPDVPQNGMSVFSRAILAAQLLEVVAMTAAKLSSAFLIERVAPQSRKAKTYLFALLCIYGVFALFALAFRCGLSTSWASQTHRCKNTGPLIAAIVFNMVTDLLLASWLFPTLLSISLDKEKRFTAMLLFGSRAIVPVVAGAQIWAAVRAVSSDDPMRDTVGFAVLSQSVTSLSLIAANIPRIKRFLGVGGSGILYPQIQASELSATRRTASHQASGDHPIKLVPSGSGRVTTTVTSKGSKEKKKSKMPPDWQGMVTLGSKEDEHTSTSSLFDRNEREGVMLEREFEVVVESRKNSK